MRKDRVYRFVGINKIGEKVSGEVSAKSELDAIRVVKFEMDIVTVLSVKQNTTFFIDIARVVSNASTKKVATDQAIRKINKRRRHRTLVKGKGKAQGTTPKSSFWSLSIGKPKTRSKGSSGLNQDELERAISLARESIFKSIEMGETSNINGFNPNRYSGDGRSERVVVVQQNSNSPLSNYSQVKQNSGGIGGDLKAQLEREEAEKNKISLDWTVLDRAKSKAKLKSKNKELVVFSHKMGILLRSGILLVDSLYIVKKAFKKKLWINTIDSLIAEVQEGNSLSDSMRRHIYIFDDFYIAVVNVGESVGTLSISFEDLTKLYKTKVSVQKKAKAAAIYPIITLSVLVIMLLGASIFFLPQFKNLFVTSNIPLPGITQFVFKVSDSVGYILVGILALLLIHGLLYKLIPVYNKYLNIGQDMLMTRLPLLKKYTQIMSMYNFSSTMSIMLKNGIGLLEALELSSKVVQNVIYKVQVGTLRGCVADGLRLSESAGQLDKLDQFTVSMIRIGEESGNLGAAFQNINEYQQEELKEFTDMLSELMQPVMLLMLAGLVVPIIIAIYLPLLQLSSGAGIAF